MWVECVYCIFIDLPSSWSSSEILMVLLHQSYLFSHLLHLMLILIEKFIYDKLHDLFFSVNGNSAEVVGGM